MERHQEDIMIIGLSGQKGSGKTFVAEWLERRGFERIAFADPLKRATMELCGWEREHVYGDFKEVVCPRVGKTPRWVLQQLGTDFVREQIGKGHWIELAWHTIKRGMVERAQLDWVIEDARFANEAEAVRSWGGIVIGLEGDSEGGEHASEAEMREQWESMTDFRVYNDRKTLAACETIWGIIEELGA
jgi:hypothetical protein